MTIKKNLHLKLVVLTTITSIALCTPFEASAEDDLVNMKKAVETAILTNPEVLQSYKTYEAAIKEKYAAYGRYLPSIDLTSSIGTEHRKDPLVTPGPPQSPPLGGTYSRDQTTLSLRQMLFDGFSTKYEVERLDKASSARLYELESISQSTAAEAAKAYIDLLRYRTLTSLSEDNYVAHKIIYEQLVLKAKAGVGKKSDVEQAQSRLALSDYNMSVEGSNLHDIEARYQRLIGYLPPKDVDTALPVKKDIPADSKSAIKFAQKIILPC